MRNELADGCNEWPVPSEKACAAMTLAPRHDCFTFARLRALRAEASAVGNAHRPIDADHCQLTSGVILSAGVLCKDDGF